MSWALALARKREQLAHPAARALGWLLCIAAMYALVVAAGDALRDPDSTLYAQIAHQLATRPVSTWIAPDFPPARFKSGPFLEHLSVFFWPAAALDRIGFSQGAVLANFFYALALLYLLFQLARRCADRETAWVAVASYLVSPLGVQYLLRANHENAWALGFLGGALCVLELNRTRWGGPLLAACAAWAFLIKGVLALAFFPVMLAIGLGVGAKRTPLWLGISALAVGAAALAYELAFRHATGHGFFAAYLQIQLGYVGTFEQRGALVKLMSPLYYGLNLLWFALPGSVLAFRAGLRAWREREARLPLRMGGLGAGVHLLVLSLMTRHAVRYIFPAYALVQLAGAPELTRLRKLRAWISEHDALLPYLSMIALPVILALRITVDLHAYRFVDVLGGLP